MLTCQLLKQCDGSLILFLAKVKKRHPAKILQIKKEVCGESLFIIFLFFC